MRGPNVPNAGRAAGRTYANAALLVGCRASPKPWSPSMTSTPPSPQAAAADVARGRSAGRRAWRPRWPPAPARPPRCSCPPSPRPRRGRSQAARRSDAAAAGGRRADRLHGRDGPRREVPEQRARRASCCGPYLAATGSTALVRGLQHHLGQGRCLLRPRMSCTSSTRADHGRGARSCTTATTPAAWGWSTRPPARSCRARWRPA